MPTAPSPPVSAPLPSVNSSVHCPTPASLAFPPFFLDRIIVVVLEARSVRTLQGMTGLGTCTSLLEVENHGCVGVEWKQGCHLPSLIRQAHGPWAQLSQPDPVLG